MLLKILIQFFFLAKSGVGSNTLKVVAYRTMADLKSADIERMENFYDCSCMIRTQMDCWLKMTLTIGNRNKYSWCVYCLNIGLTY